MLFMKKQMHFLGIGGAGMCPMAEIMAKQGHQVTGSDLQQSAASQRLASLGIRVQYNHTPDIVRESDLLIYSSAIRPENPELVYARDHGITCMKRAEMLGDIMRERFSVGVCGTHGKTTTTSLIGNIFRDADMDPLVIVGGAFRDSESHAIIGEGKIVIAEADEYDRSFLHMYPSVALVTNIEADHLDIYKDLHAITDAFVEFINRVPFYGMAITCEDDAVSNQIRDRIKKTLITYGTSENAVYRADDISFDTSTASFTVVKKDTPLGGITMPLYGLHNVRNALAAITVAHEMQVPFKTIQKSLEKFTGIKRRFEVMGTRKNISVIDDYAHHPTEITATLSAAESAGFKRCVAVFQPHLYSRTRDFCDEFAVSLTSADLVVVTGIYQAREEPIPGVTGSTIIEKMHENGYSNAHFVKTLDELPDFLVPLLQPGDGVILMGAGDIWEVGEQLLER
ncbi:MAG: UDP-N-acetylmuramate--L-alanine ligase, partial [bacterium]|nr:UDP-N-acetylmuramate--L-alanine ligase [bacterium]